MSPALGVTPEQPGPPRGHPGLGSWWHQSGTARGGGDGAGTPERVPKTRDPRGAAESFEMEEVLSEDDDDDDDDGDDDDDDDDDEAARSPHPALRTPRRSPFPGLSDSSGFSEGAPPPLDPPCPVTPPRVTRGHLGGTRDPVRVSLGRFGHACDTRVTPV
ncbi:uncharacterized protein M8220_014704 [Acridotheres tristis]